MIGAEPRWFGRPAIKPGHLPEPLDLMDELHTCDTLENIATCQTSCPFPDDCHQGSALCPLNQKMAERKNHAILEQKLLDLILRGWVNREAICEELGISKNVYYATKRRLMERGEIQ